MQQGLRALQIAERAGVTVCYGTDLLVSMHALQTEEVSQRPSFLAGIATHRPSQFAVRASVLSAATILKQATTNAGELNLVLRPLRVLLSGISAKLVRREGQLGVIAPGAIADLIVLDANPLDDICVLDRPETHLFAVIKEGRIARSRITSLPVELLA